MIEPLIKLKTAKLAKEKGFNGLCEYLYDDERGTLEDIVHTNKDFNKERRWYSAPTQTTVQNWLREFGVEVWAKPFLRSSKEEAHPVIADNTYSFFVYKDSIRVVDGVDFESFQKALEKGLEEALKLL